MRNRVVITFVVTLCLCLLGAKVAIKQNSIRITSDTGVYWGSSTTNIDTIDVGIERQAANIAKFTDGAAALGGVTVRDSGVYFNGQAVGDILLKRSATVLEARLGDDTGFASLEGSNVYATTAFIASDGTHAAPAQTFLSNPGVGFYLGSGYPAVAENGAGCVYFSSSFPGGGGYDAGDKVNGYINAFGGGTALVGPGIAGGHLGFHAGDGSAAKAGSGSDGGAGGSVYLLPGAGAAGDGAGSTGVDGTVIVDCDNTGTRYVTFYYFAPDNQIVTTGGGLTITTGGAAVDITLNARSGPITVNDASNASLVSFTATSIVGALNELKAGKILLSNEAHVTTDTLTTTEAISVHTNTGATDDITLTLPSAPTNGITFWIMQTTSQRYMNVDPGNSDHFIYSGGVMTDGEFLKLNSVGAKIQVCADANGDWVVLEEQGTLTEETP